MHEREHEFKPAGFSDLFFFKFCFWFYEFKKCGFCNTNNNRMLFVFPVLHNEAVDEAQRARACERQRERFKPHEEQRVFVCLFV